MRVLVPVLAAFLTLALGVGSAGAVTRYASPGGTAADPCTNATAPCSLHTAADGSAPGTTIASGDVVEMAPGNYSEAAGDLGPSKYVQPPPGVAIRGEAGKPRPLIRLESNAGVWGAFFVGSGASVSQVEIVNEGASGSAVTIIEGGSVTRVIAHTTASSAVTCTITEGVLRDSVCFNEAGGVAVGASTATFAGTHSVILRNVTAIATGAGSVGLEFGYFASSAGVIGQVNGKSVLAKGEAKDVIARGMTLGNPTTGPGASTTITLDHSRYATTEAKTSGTGSAAVTAPGTNNNITAEPMLAADGYHQIAASPTLDKGGVDGSSGASDIDGQLRKIGSAPDIGADELAHATLLTIACSPETLVASGESSGTAKCPVTVTDTAAGGTAPTGIVKFGTDGGIITNFCSLTPISAVASNCGSSWSSFASGLGAHHLTARYEGDQTHEGSEGSATIDLIAPPTVGGGGSSGGAGGGGGGTGGGGEKSHPAPATRLGRHPPKRGPKQLATFTFSSDQPGSRFECKLDKGKFKPCGSPFKRKVPVGPHNFRVRAVTAEGLQDTTPVAFRWTRTGA